MRPALFSLFLILLCTPAQANLRDGLIGWWTFDELSGNAIDSSWNGNTGTPTGTILVGSCAVGRCRSFNGISDYVNPSTVTLSTEYTISVWINTRTVSANGAGIGFRSTVSANPIYFQIDHNNADARMIVRDDAGNIATASFTSSITTNEWFNLIGIRNGDTVSIYVNGVKGTDGTNTFGAITGNSLNIGALTAGSSSRTVFLSGQIDDVRIYNRALSQQEILNLYNIGALIKGTGTQLTN